MEVIFEFIKYKGFVKVSAIDARTGLEAVVSAPSKLSRKEMEDLAYKRLIYLKNKQK